MCSILSEGSCPSVKHTTMCMGYRVRGQECETQPLPFLTARLWVSDFTSLSLSLLNYKMGNHKNSDLIESPG